MLYFDPPYNIGLDYHHGLGGKKTYGGKKTHDTKSPEDYARFIESTIRNGLEHAKIDTHAFCYCDANSIGLIQDIYRKLSLEPRRVCLWIKNNMNATPLIAFNKVYEPCIYATR